MIHDGLPQVTIFTDGSCLGNPGPGGWAARLEAKGTVKLLSGGFAQSTNNRMEMYAVIQALAALTRQCRVDLYTDSKYVCDAVNKKWLASWQRNGWKKADKKKVINTDLWQQLIPLIGHHSVSFHWVRGHADSKENIEVDLVARAAAAKGDLPLDVGFALSRNS